MFDNIYFLNFCRILSNRVSAQKSRLKKLQYVIEMEKKAKALQVHTIQILSSEIN